MSGAQIVPDNAVVFGYEVPFIVIDASGGLLFMHTSPVVGIKIRSTTGASTVKPTMIFTLFEPS